MQAITSTGLAGGARRGGVTYGEMPKTAGTTSRLAWLDALRGFAALCVVFDHGSTLLLLPVRSFLYQWFNFGEYGVFVFFLVSGYIIPASLERKGSLRAFWTSRGFRLYPMYAAAIVLAAIATGTGSARSGAPSTTRSRRSCRGCSCCRICSPAPTCRT